MLKLYATIAVISYLLGSIPFGYILVKLFLKQDIRQTGSGNIGATNVARSGKKGLAIATLLLDAGKGAAAVVIAGWSARGSWSAGYVPGSLPAPGYRLELEALAALFAILGHVLPMWLGFRGGKGVATAVGAFSLVAPMAVVISFAIFLVVFSVFRYVSMSSIASAFVFPVVALVLLHDHLSHLATALLILGPIVIIFKHHANIRRLLNGTEPKFGAKKPAITTDPIQAEKNA